MNWVVGLERLDASRRRTQSDRYLLGRVSSPNPHFAGLSGISLGPTTQRELGTGLSPAGSQTPSAKGVRVTPSESELALDFLEELTGLGLKGSGNPHQMGKLR